MNVRARAYPHPTDTSVCIIDRLDDHGQFVASRAVDWGDAPPWASVIGGVAHGYVSESVFAADATASNRKDGGDV